MLVEGSVRHERALPREQDSHDVGGSTHPRNNEQDARASFWVICLLFTTPSSFNCSTQWG
jgi:hypothetical protein